MIELHVKSTFRTRPCPRVMDAYGAAMKFLAMVVLFLGALPALGHVGEKYEELEKRMGKAQMRWTEEGGVTVYCHVQAIPDRWGQLSQRPESEASKKPVKFKRRYQFLACVVEGVCLAEKFYPATYGEAVRIICDQPDQKSLHRQNVQFQTMFGGCPVADWAFADGRKVRYSSEHGALVVIHPQWRDPRLVDSLRPTKVEPEIRGICPGFLPPLKNPLSPNEPWRLIERQPGDMSPSKPSYTFPDEPWRVREPSP